VERVLRTALRPRWLALLAVVLVAASGMAALGDWQLRRAREQGQVTLREQAARPAVPLPQLLAPRSHFPASAGARRVVLSGTWDGGGQQVVTGRLRDGATGVWVLTPLRLADGSGVGVVRGWAPAAGDPAVSAGRLPAGPVRLTGVLLPDEAGAEQPPGSPGPPAGRLDRIDPVLLAGRWDYPLPTGYVVADTPGPGLAAVDVIGTGGGLALQNLSYAVQWWAFAVFGLILWFRLVRDDHRGVLRPRTAA
jgi:cytochrome oxidase assembly protein ShyY1